MLGVGNIERGTGTTVRGVGTVLREIAASCDGDQAFVTPAGLSGESMRVGGGTFKRGLGTVLRGSGDRNA